MSTTGESNSRSVGPLLEADVLVELCVAVHDLQPLIDQRRGFGVGAALLVHSSMRAAELISHTTM